MVFRKALFFGIFLFSNVAITVAAEQIQKDGFEAVVKRGYYDFLDAVGQEKSKELGFEEPIERKIKEEEKHPIEMKITIPLVAQGYEAVYQRFLNGVLIYRPNNGSDAGMVTLPISDLANPLEGTFDLSRCGDAGNYLSISTGYRKGKKPENANKVEIWFTPRFLIEKELNGTAQHFQGIFGNWKDDIPMAIFWTWGGWDLNCYGYSLEHYISTYYMCRSILRAQISEGALIVVKKPTYLNERARAAPYAKNFEISWLS